MARIALLAALLGGCLLPPPDEEMPLEQNLPPRIVPSTPAPTKGPFPANTNCSYRFIAQVNDPEGDLIYWRVFIDYHRLAQPYAVQVLEHQPDAGVPLEFVVDANSFSLPLSDAHTVELFISDRPFYLDEREPWGRAVQPGGETDFFIWPVQLSNDPDEVCFEPSQ